jgi:hypothetical protein
MAMAMGEERIEALRDISRNYTKSYVSCIQLSFQV